MMPQSTTVDNKSPAKSASVTPPPERDPKAVAESAKETVSKPGGFKNDPDEPTNPNEEIERYREKLRR